MIFKPTYLPGTIVYIKTGQQVIVGTVEWCEHNGAGWVYHIMGLMGRFDEARLDPLPDGPVLINKRNS